ncbi:MAG: ribonuclease III [Limnospira sp. PMC 1291.21]|uniref:Ribonuclease 3 n=3 Tax=Limnospira TaxID=2596745 RepID=A0A9P1KAV6_9CYAN|nr:MULTISPECIES: ribonuclease III [Limnospira]EKD10174.1 ribonuclease III [Arthrospira platensis C1]MDC0838539.1 ribonuclease III [Limnoraphis robusta]MDY7051852.1 ribonuclease III [Limnospira fusiformis LS22]QJB28597.1 ribonuclease III [Limnospira fusiformis SAG 85.79]EDZ91960.1 Ribonuclease III [Limnospira maxima CS-328]
MQKFNRVSHPQRQNQLEKLIERLGLSTQQKIAWQLLDLALTHPSVSTQDNYEQLEFVGDSVVRLVASELLLETYPNAPVGEFAAVRSILVSDRILAEISNSYGLGRYLLVGGSATRDRLGEESRLADCFEAVLAALYLSTNTLELIRPWLDQHLLERATDIFNDPARQNYKAALQEWTQSCYKILPQYKVNETGYAGDEARFTASVWLRGEQLGTGTGRTIKAAEQAAARVAFLSVAKNGGQTDNE